MERQEERVADADQQRRHDQHDARARLARGHREQHRADDERDQVDADEVRALGGIEPQAVPERAVGAGVGRQRALRAEQADADEERRRLHGPHLGAAEHTDVDRGVFLRQLVAHEPHEHRDAGRDERDDPPPSRRAQVQLADHAHPGEAAGHEQQPPREDDEAPRVERAALLGRRFGHEQPDHDGDQGHRDGGHDHRRGEVGGRREDAPGGEGADDRPGLQADDEQTRRAPGRGDAVLPPSTALEDERDLERQPHDVEALQRPRGQERPERRREREPPRRTRGEDRRDQQDALVAVHVAELGEHRHDEGRQQQLRRLEPVDVGIVDAERHDDVAEQGHVEALQDAADELDEHEPPDEGRRHPHGRGAQRRSRSGEGTRCRRLWHGAQYMGRPRAV